MTVMQRFYRPFFLTAMLAVLIASAGFAHSKDAPRTPRTRPLAHTLRSSAAPVSAAAVVAPVAARATESAAGSALQPRFDAAALLTLGTVLFGLAAVVRKVL
jgi:hypothetical protein